LRVGLVWVLKYALAFLFVTILSQSVVGEELHVTFGAVTDLAVKYGKYDVTGNAKQLGDVDAPRISIGGLDLDGHGASDDEIQVQFAVSATGGDLARFARGYRLDSGYTLTFEIVSASMVLGTGHVSMLDGRFVSAAGNNRAASFSLENKGQVLTLRSTAAANNRVRDLVVRFDVPVDTSSLAAPLMAPVANEPALDENGGRKETKKPKAAPLRVRPSKVTAPPKIVTDSLLIPRLFCDNMVLQQQTTNTFWGWSRPGEKISVRASWGATASVEADSDGRWRLFLETPHHGTGHSLTISGEQDTINVENVAIGEVWLCAGQSNMGWSMGNSFEADKESDVNLPDFRIFKSAREHWHTPLDMPRDRLSQWKPCNPGSAAETSAVSYYFGKKLHQELVVPVGIIQQAYAGTPIEGWMPWEIQKDDPRSQVHKSELDDRAATIGSWEEALAEFERQLADYNASIDAGNTMKNAVKPLSPPIITKPPDLGHQYPGHQFNAMIHPIRPYGIRGMIWYQGERNSKDVPQAANYRKQLALLIEYYRSSWHRMSGGGVPDDFPFQFTQLPSWTPHQTAPVEGLEAPWAVNREMMRLVALDVPNTAMAVSIDTGDAVALHPKNKKPIGIRHAYLALKRTYGRDFVDYGPRYTGHSIRSDTIVLQFDSVGGGMVPAKPGALDAFAIAGEDRVWHWARAEIEGNTVIVSSPQVSTPVAVRYAWSMNPSQRNLLYNQEGIPASPFRTDDWPLFDPDADIVTVQKPDKPDVKTSVDWDRPKMTQ
jgi:sialate O-acetylesterase